MNFVVKLVDRTTGERPVFSPVKSKYYKDSNYGMPFVCSAISSILNDAEEVSYYAMDKRGDFFGLEFNFTESGQDYICEMTAHLGDGEGLSEQSLTDFNNMLKRFS